jgi:hypothetical protein
VLWVAAIAIGMRILFAHAGTPGDAAAPPERWPDASGIRRRADCPTLLMFAHPCCPCTRASVAELNLLMARLAGKLEAYVLLFTPGELPAGWGETDASREGERIPGVTVLRDVDGAEAKRFGVATSGQTIVYNAAGSLIFHGGITGARGHIGENLGRSTITSLIETGEAASTESRVYGCALHAPGEDQSTKERSEP